MSMLQCYNYAGQLVNVDYVIAHVWEEINRFYFGEAFPGTLHIFRDGCWTYRADNGIMMSQGYEHAAHENFYPHDEPIKIARLTAD